MYILGVNIYFQRHGFTGKKKQTCWYTKMSVVAYLDETR